MLTTLRIGAVSYLNAKPLYYRLTEFAPNLKEEPGDRGGQRRGWTSVAVWNRLGILVACGSLS